MAEKVSVPRGLRLGVCEEADLCDPHDHTENSGKYKSPHMRAEENQLAQEMLDARVVELSTSPWSSRVLQACKKDWSLRFCVDYRRLNDVTLKDAQPLSRVNNSLESLKSAKFFSTLDLQSGYYLVGPLSPQGQAQDSTLHQQRQTIKI